MAQDNESKLQGEFSSPVETSSESHSAKLEAPTTTADHNATATTTTIKQHHHHNNVVD